MFKVIILLRYYGLGDHQIQCQIIDRTSFRQFLGIHIVEEVPDEKTVWKYREQLSKAGTFDELFNLFRSVLDDKGLRLKDGKGDSLWNPEGGDDERTIKRKRNKEKHKDLYASWTKKRDETHYGYKGHVKSGRKTKLIERYKTTTAMIHHSNVIKPIIEESDKDQNLYLDAGYTKKKERGCRY